MPHIANRALTLAGTASSNGYIQDGAESTSPGHDASVRADGDNAVMRDQTARDMHKPALLDYLRHAQSKSGRRPMEMVAEYFRLSRARGRLTLPEYVQYGVYDRARYSPEQQGRFITNTLHWPITHACCDMTWQATTEDKWLCSHILARSTVAVPQTLAVIDKTERAYPGTRKISTAQQLRDLVTAPDILPLFAKENRGICSFGAFVVSAADDSAMFLHGYGRITYDTLMDRFIGTAPYLFQSVVRNHSFFDRFTQSLATTRVCVLVTETDVKIPFAVLKLPSRDNVADSFWRPGNLACKVDPANGRVLTMRSKDALGTTDLATHPETGTLLVGEMLPMWDRVLDMVSRCATIFQPVRYQSMDIAITQDGPVLVEINTGGGFDLPQLATGEGFLTDEVCDFFRRFGYKKL